MQETAVRLDRFVGEAPAPGDGAAAAGAAADDGGMDVEDAPAGNTLLAEARSRILSALRLADNLATACSVPEALAARLFDRTLALLEGAIVAGEDGAACAHGALELLSDISPSLDAGGGGDVDAPPVHLLERMPRVHVQLLARIAAPAPFVADEDAREAVEDAAKEAVTAALCIGGALRDAAAQFVPDYITACANAAAARDMPIKDRLRAATALGGFAVSVSAVTVPLVPRCVAALIALSSSRELIEVEEGAGARDEADDEGAEDGAAADEEEDDEEAIDRLARSRLCVLRSLRRLFVCAAAREGARGDGDAGLPLLRASLEPFLEPIAAMAKAWSVGPAAFLSLEDEEEDGGVPEDAAEDGGDGMPLLTPDSVAAAVLELLLAATRCIGPAAALPHLGLREKWVQSLLERALRDPGKALRKLAVKVKRDGLLGAEA